MRHTILPSTVTTESSRLKTYTMFALYQTQLTQEDVIEVEVKVVTLVTSLEELDQLVLKDTDLMNQVTSVSKILVLTDRLKIAIITANNHVTASL